MRMRVAIVPHAPTVAIFLALLAMAGGFAATLAPLPDTLPAIAALPSDPIALPGPGEDDDNDTYANAVDTWPGNLQVLVTVADVEPRQAGGPMVLVGTQDDHWRTGAGAELEWPHVVDVDPLGRRPGSPGWWRESVRTGQWILREAGSGTASVLIDVRDDRTTVALEVHAYDRHSDPDRRVGSWVVHVPVAGGPVALEGAPSPEGARLWATFEPRSGLGRDEQQAIAQRWAPILHFAEDEAFLPVPGDALQRFHGFYRREPDLRTWTNTFNGGRDGYRLFLADFNGDRKVDHADARVMVDVLVAGGVAPPTVHANVVETGDGQVVVQYWFLYFYNFVADDAGRDVQALAHLGDREFMHLRFASLEAARNGTPETIAYSQHYHGIVVPYEPGAAPFHVDDGRPAVFVARGSHASYPVAGDDRALRAAYLGYGDVFDGAGPTLGPDAYQLEVLGTQSWHAGHLWGPLTRYTRDLGTSTKPLLQHHFRYPFVDPLLWERSLPVVPADDLADLYGGKGR